MSLRLLSANHGAALAATLAARANRHGRGFCSGVYPITPSTECMEYLCLQEIEKGRVVRVESEHSAMGVCIGASAAGARAFTITSSNGLAYMTENCIAAAALRLPVVLAVANRTLGPPWNIWADHGDALTLRDHGLIQFLLRRQSGTVRHGAMRLPTGGGSRGDDAGHGLHGRLHSVAHRGPDRDPGAGAGGSVSAAHRDPASTRRDAPHAGADRRATSDGNASSPAPRRHARSAAGIRRTSGPRSKRSSAAGRPTRSSPIAPRMPKR